MDCFSFIYTKTCNHCGLTYLGKTIVSNQYKINIVKKAGMFFNDHIKLFNIKPNDIDTEILGVFIDNKIEKDFCISYINKYTKNKKIVKDLKKNYTDIILVYGEMSNIYINKNNQYKRKNMAIFTENNNDNKTKYMSNIYYKNEMFLSLFGSFDKPDKVWLSKDGCLNETGYTNMVVYKGVFHTKCDTCKMKITNNFHCEEHFNNCIFARRKSSIKQLQESIRRKRNSSLIRLKNNLKSLI